MYLRYVSPFRRSHAAHVFEQIALMAAEESGDYE